MSNNILVKQMEQIQKNIEQSMIGIQNKISSIET